MDPFETRLQRVERILAISQELVSNRSRDDLLQHVIQAATELTNCESAAILLVDESADILRFIAVTLFQERLLQFPVPVECSIAGEAFSSNQTIIENSPNDSLRYYSKVAELTNYHARTLLAVPLTFQDHKIGVLEVENKKDDQSFDEADAHLLTDLAIQATIAIENARQVENYKKLAQAEQNQRELAEALRLASAAITGTLDYDQVVDRILEEVSQVVPSDTSNMMILEAGDIARVFRGRGYAKFGTVETINATILKLHDAVYLQRMLETRQPVVVSNAMEDPSWAYSRPEHHWIRSYVGVPIIVRDSVVGFLNANSAIPNFYDQTHAKRLQAFAHQAANAIENARLYRQAQQEIAERMKVEKELRHHRDHLEELVKERTAEVHRLAITDSLTNVFNRGHLMVLGKQVLNQAQRYSHLLTVMMLDIDHFKKINDSYGHAIGDEALRKLAGQMRKDLRSTDIIGRYGGEEFVALMPETDLETARQVAERLLASIRTMQIHTEKGPFHMTASIGLAGVDHTQQQTIDALIAQADQSMYIAKESGRDRLFIKHSDVSR